MQKKKIEFIQNFTSPLFGNVYIGKKATLDAQEAERQVKLGHAVMIDTPDEAPRRTRGRGK